jgi:hypothetical protein
MLLLVDPHVIALPVDARSGDNLVAYFSELSKWTDVFNARHYAVLSEVCALAIQSAGCVPEYDQLKTLWRRYGDETIGMKDVYRSIKALLETTPYLEDRIPTMRQIEVYDDSVTSVPNLFERVLEPARQPFRQTVGCIAYACNQEYQTDAISILTHPLGSSTAAQVTATIESSAGSQSLQAQIPLRTDPDVLDDLLVDSWSLFIALMARRYTHLRFCASVIENLTDPYDEVIADTANHLLSVLNELKQCFDCYGRRTERGNELIEMYFRGYNAKFSDESETKKVEFNNELTFPIALHETLFCPFHGKINRKRYRLHFSWPIRHNEPLYVVYLGPKITKD